VVVDAKDCRRQFRAADVKSQNVLRVRHVSKAQQAPTDSPIPGPRGILNHNDSWWYGTYPLPKADPRR
jgi:hypothetical protein